MDHEMEVEVFRAGDYGPRGCYSEEDLEQIATDYNPFNHEAPVTVDHKQDGPALGWVRALRRVGSVLIAKLGALDLNFMEKLRSGAFKKRSIELYRNADWSKRPYLRAVSFLGACPPAVKGLADPVFSEEEDQMRIEFEEREEKACETPSESLAPENEDAMCENSEAMLNESTLAQQNDTPEPVEADSPPDESDSEMDEKVAQFCDRMRKEGKLLPAWEEFGISRFLSMLDGKTPITFSDGDNAETTLRDWFERFLEMLPSSVPMGEAAHSVHFSASSFATDSFAFSDRAGNRLHGPRIDPESLSLHRRVERFRSINPHLSYTEALHSVAGLRQS